MDIIKVLDWSRMHTNKHKIKKAVSILIIIGFICSTMPDGASPALNLSSTKLRLPLYFGNDKIAIQKRQEREEYGDNILGEVLKNYSGDTVLGKARNFVINFINNADPVRRRRINYHNVFHCNELLMFCDAMFPNIMPLLKKPERSKRLSSISCYFHDLGYYDSDNEALAKEHEERSKLIVREFFDKFKDVFGLRDLECQAVEYMVGKTEMKNGKGFENEVKEDNSAYEFLERLNKGQDLTLQEIEFLKGYLIKNNFTMTERLDDVTEKAQDERAIIMDGIIWGKLIAVADLYGHSETYPYLVAFLQPELMYDDYMLGGEDSKKLAKPSWFEQITGTLDFLESVEENRLKYILEPLFSGNLALGPKIPKKLVKKRKLNIEKMKKLRIWISELTQGINPETNRNELVKFVNDGRKMGVYKPRDVTILYAEIKAFLKEGNQCPLRQQRSVLSGV